MHVKHPVVAAYLAGVRFLNILLISTKSPNSMVRIMILS